MAVSYAIQLTELFALKHFIGNFLPQQMAEFISYYMGYEACFGIPKIIAVLHGVIGTFSKPW